jgi:hypothetical protein
MPWVNSVKPYGAWMVSVPSRGSAGWIFRYKLAGNSRDSLRLDAKGENIFNKIQRARQLELPSEEAYGYPARIIIK